MSETDNGPVTRACFIPSYKGVAGRESLTRRREGVPPEAEIHLFFDEGENGTDRYQ